MLSTSIKEVFTPIKNKNPEKNRTEKKSAKGSAKYVKKKARNARTQRRSKPGQRDLCIQNAKVVFVCNFFKIKN